MKNKFKCLAILNTCLFFALAFKPCSGATEEIVVTAVLYGEEIEERSVKLSGKKLAELENLINKIKKSLDNVDTREEMVEIFEEAMQSLSEYGFFSKKRAEKLVGRYFIKEDENVVCLIAGRTDETYFIHFGTEFLWKIATAFYYLALWAWENDLRFLEKLFISFRSFLVSIYYYILFPYDKFANLFQVGHRIYMGRLAKDGTLHGAEGWIYSEGLIGIRRWGGSFWGGAPLPPIRIRTGFTYPCVLGFTGVKLIMDHASNEHFYMGCALSVKVSSEPPF